MGPIEEAEVILVTHVEDYLSAPQDLNCAVQNGATAILLSLPTGWHAIGTHSVEVRQAGMGPRHFVSCDSGHPMVEGFDREDFKFRFDETTGHATPLLTTVLEADGWTPILLSGDGGWGRSWSPVPVAAERADGKGFWRICQVELFNRLKTNPAATLFTARLLTAKNPLADTGKFDGVSMEV
jgi:hypothetical protein